MIKLFKFFCQRIFQKEYWKTILGSLVCLLAKVQKYYLNSLLNRAFLEFLSHGIYGGTIGSENWFRFKPPRVFTIRFKFHCKTVSPTWQKTWKWILTENINQNFVGVNSLRRNEYSTNSIITQNFIYKKMLFCFV